jgi:predicted nucleic acid-binding protein
MILIDTSVWIDHFRAAEPMMARLTEEETILMHPLVFGELAMGNFANRSGVLKWLADFIPAVLADHDEVLGLIESQALHGKGLGFVDAHLIASARLMPSAKLWARDKRMLLAAAAAGISVLAETRH